MALKLIQVLIERFIFNNHILTCIKKIFKHGYSKSLTDPEYPGSEVKHSTVRNFQKLKSHFTL
jgi:hypothetical protein